MTKVSSIIILYIYSTNNSIIGSDASNDADDFYVNKEFRKSEASQVADSLTSFGDNAKSVVINSTKKRKGKGKSQRTYSSILSRLPNSNGNLEWKVTSIGKLHREWSNGFNFTKKLVMVTDPYNPLARTKGISLY